MYRNPYASLATDEPRFQRPKREESTGGSTEGFKRVERSTGGEGFKRAERSTGEGFKRAERSTGSGSTGGTEGFKRADRSTGGGTEGFKRAEGFKVEASSFPALNGQAVKTRAPVWVVGQDTSQVIARALQVKTPPPPAVPVVPLPPFEGLEGYDSSEDEDIPTFEEVCHHGSWGDSNWED